MGRDPENTQTFMKKWLVKNINPETLILHTLESVSDTIYQLPIALESIQKNASLNSEIKLHPETIKQIQNKSAHKILKSFLVVLFLLLIVGYLNIL